MRIIIRALFPAIVRQNPLISTYRPYVASRRIPYLGDNNGFTEKNRFVIIGTNQREVHSQCIIRLDQETNALISLGYQRYGIRDTSMRVSAVLRVTCIPFYLDIIPYFCLQIHSACRDIILISYSGRVIRWERSAENPGIFVRINVYPRLASKRGRFIPLPTNIAYDIISKRLLGARVYC